MTTRRRLTLLLAGAAMCAGTGCGRHDARPAKASRAVDRPVAVPDGANWRAIATAADRRRLSGWRTAWTAALAKAKEGGFGPQLAAQGPLLSPDAALATPAPPPGDYRCRVFKLGHVGAGRDYIAYPYFACRLALEGDILSFTKLDGSQKPVGLLFPDTPTRMTFLGTMLLADERRPIDYGRDPDRDLAGVWERVDRARWRLVLPYPRWESMLDVLEVVPR